MRVLPFAYLSSFLVRKYPAMADGSWEEADFGSPALLIVMVVVVPMAMVVLMVWR